LFTERASPLLERIDALKERDITNDLQIKALCLELENLKGLFQQLRPLKLVEEKPK
jgi:hypothetical protein